MRKKIITLICTVLSLQLTAQTVDIATVRNVARNIQELESPAMLRSAGEIRITTLRGEGAEPLVHIAEYAEGGFAIISGDKRAPAILGHTNSGSFDPENMPPALLLLIELYKAEIQEIIELDIQPEEEVINDWQQLSGNELPATLRASRPYLAGDTLITTRWGQSGGWQGGSDVTFNYFTPGTGPAGCVAVAMAQILRFWACRIAPAGSRGGINFANRQHPWTKMSDTYADKYNARLIHYAGVSARTNYTDNWALSYPWRARDAFVDNWGISSNATTRWRIWNLRNWEEMIRDEIRAGRPVFYSAVSIGRENHGLTQSYHLDDMGGHAWVITGFKHDGRFHCNWGWGGRHDGWFRIGRFNPRVDAGFEHENFNQMQNAIFGVEPRERASVGTPQLGHIPDFAFNTAGHVLSVGPVYGATRYEWTTTNGRIVGTGTTATLFASGIATVSVRAHNALCGIYSPASSAMVSVSNGPIIARDGGTTTVSEYTIRNMIPGTTVTWTLSNTTDFEFVGASTGERVKVRKEVYNARGVLTAQIHLQGYNDLFIRREITSERWEIRGERIISCQNVTFMPSVIFPNTEDMRWTASHGIEILPIRVMGGGVVVRGTSNNQHGWIQLEVSQNGQIYRTRKNIDIRVPHSFSLSVEHLWMENGWRRALIRAIPVPFVQYDYFAYRWSISAGGFIRPTANNPLLIDVTDRELSDIREIVVADGPNLISRDVVGDNVLDQIGRVVNRDDFQLTVVAVAENFSAPNSGSVLLEISFENTAYGEAAETEYVLLRQEQGINSFNTPTLPPLHDTSHINDFEVLPFIPVDDPSFAIATFRVGIDMTITCTFITPCDKIFTASVFIPATTFICSFNPSTRSIHIDRQDGGGSAFSNFNFDAPTYQVRLYNDRGLVRTQDFSSAENSVVVPLTGLPSGIYIVNIVNEQGMLIESQAVPAP